MQPFLNVKGNRYPAESANTTFIQTKLNIDNPMVLNLLWKVDFPLIEHVRGASCPLGF